MSKKWLVVGVAAALLIAAFLLRPGPETDTNSVVFIVPELSNPYFVDLTDAAKAEAANQDVAITIQAPPAFANVEQQIAMIESAVAQKADVICLVASDSKAVVPAIKQAQDAGIAVLLVDNTIDEEQAAALNVTVLGHVGSDNYLGGKLAGEFIAESLKQSGNVAMLEGILGSDVANARRDGFRDGIKSHSDITVVASQTANYSREEGLNVFQSILQAHPDLDAVFAANDEMALGAIRAIEEAGRTEPLLIVGFDATDDGLDAIKSGRMHATIAQDPKSMGRKAIQLASDAMNNRPVPPQTLIPVRLVTSAE